MEESVKAGAGLLWVRVCTDENRIVLKSSTITNINISTPTIWAILLIIALDLGSSEGSKIKKSCWKAGLFYYSYVIDLPNRYTLKFSYS